MPGTIAALGGDAYALPGACRRVERYSAVHVTELYAGDFFRLETNYFSMAYGILIGN